MMTIVMLGLAAVLSVILVSAALPRFTPSPVFYLHAATPVEAGGGDLGIALIIFATLALVVAMAV